MFTKLRELLVQYWRSGITGAVIMCDLVALLVGVIDVFRFKLLGLSPGEAMSTTAEFLSRSQGLRLLGISVFCFFGAALPMSALLIGNFSPIETWPRALKARSSTITIAHFIFSALIGWLSVLSLMMEVLSGWAMVTDDGQGRSFEYAFPSYWLHVVLLWNFISVVYLSPIAKKLFWRVAAKEHGRPSQIATETIKEVLTEHDLKD